MSYFRLFFCTLVLLVIAGKSKAQRVTVVKLPQLQSITRQSGDTTYVINFWATWCKPCVAELPHFERLNAQYARRKVKVILVSMDFVSRLEDKVKPFVRKRGLKSTVWLLNEPDQDAMISAVDPQWSGAIPFTLMIRPDRNRRKTFEKEFTWAELEKETQAFLP